MIDLKGDSADVAIGTATTKLLQQIRPNLPPEQLADDILKKEQRIAEIMLEIKKALGEPLG